MKKILSRIALLLLFLANWAASAWSQDHSTSQSLLWRITGKDLKRPSYLFGTIHLICREDFLWTQKMQQSLDKSEKVCFELNLSDPAEMMNIAGSFVDTTGKKLSDYFTGDEYAMVKKYVHDSLGMDLSVFESTKPIALQGLFAASGLDCKDPVSYEDSLLKMATSADKEVLGLDKPDEVAALENNIPADTIIKQVLDQMQSGSDSDLTQMITAYKHQDLPGLFKIITSSRTLGDGLDQFLDDRNKNWLPRMTAYMSKSSVFFAVGAGHLWGDNGLITLLRRQGYTVIPWK